ncbi:MAG: hypothetical protein KAV87_58675, partial [Desulfobacteraceae bacterium]|nr:hypothetical protein [Desulfobacteraceae bacterium]
TSIEPITDINVIRVKMMTGHQSRVRIKVNRLSNINLTSHKTATNPRDRLFILALPFGKGICDI